MKIIQSFWSKPAFGSISLSNDSRSNGGWINRKYYYFSLTLSCLKLLEFYDRVELYTDLVGKKLLIEVLQLPYTYCHTDLEKINHLYNEYLWTIGKLFVYGLQSEPFIHVDNDIFIWSRFDERIHEASLVAQNPEYNQDYYQPIVQCLIRCFELPKWLMNELKSDKKIIVSNTGIIGGNNFEFFKYYSKKSLSLVNNNFQNLEFINIGAFSVFVEQYMFHFLANDLNTKVEYLIKRFIDYQNDPILMKFEEIPSRNTFIHPVAGGKQNYDINRYAEMSLRLEYPEYYFKILKLLYENKI